MEDDPEHRIRLRAYELWDQAGRPDGNDLEFWLAAEREIDEAELDREIEGSFPASDPSSSTMRHAKAHARQAGPVNPSDDNPTPPGHEPGPGHDPKEGKLSGDTVKDGGGENPTPPGQEPGSKGTTSNEK